MESKKCTYCNNVFPVDNFYKSNQSKDGYQCHCKECHKRYGKSKDKDFQYKIELHGDSKTKLYKAWCDMKRRCYSEKVVNYNNYGGRGICVCKEWIDSYTSFRDWAINNNYNALLTLDRIDVNGNYEPNNCRWISQSEQCMNKRCFNSTGYIGIHKSSDGSGYYGNVKKDGKNYYTGYSTDLTECVLMRDKFIIKNNFKHKRSILID